jgi:hypothetical protein
MTKTELQKELIARLQEVAAELGLLVGIPAGEEVGAIIGTQAFIEDVSNIVGEEEYTVEEEIDAAIEQQMLSGKKPNGKDPSYH